MKTRVLGTNIVVNTILNTSKIMEIIIPFVLEIIPFAIGLEEVLESNLSLSTSNRSLNT